MDNPRTHANVLASVAGANAYRVAAGSADDALDSYRYAYESVLAASPAYDGVPMTELSDAALDAAYAYARYARDTR